MAAEKTQLHTAMTWLDQQCAANALGGEDAARLAIVLEELFLNVAENGGAPPPSVELTFVREPLALQLVVEDDGAPFDPTAAPPPDFSVAANERDAGGLGIHLVMRLMDEVSYTRAGDLNRLVLRKFITPP